MENSIKIKSNAKRINVEKEDGTNRMLIINPDDLVFIKKLYDFYSNAQKKAQEYNGHVLALSKDKTKDALGIPKNLEKLIEVNLKYADYMREKVDDIFGEGTSQDLFGESRDFTSIYHFIEDLMPFINSSRQSKMDKYLEEEGTEDGLE